MSRCDWLLLSVGDGLEPIKLQKLLFKFANESTVMETDKYDFEPYNWGPCSFKIYDDIGELKELGLVEAIPSGQGWSSYKLTGSGNSKANELRGSLDARLLSDLDGLRSWVTSRSFDQLLRDVYEDYPDYAEKTLYRH